MKLTDISCYVALAFVMTMQDSVAWDVGLERKYSCNKRVGGFRFLVEGSMPVLGGSRVHELM